jgi:hypothetical protein
MKLIFALFMVMCATGVFGQGFIVFDNRIAGLVIAWVYGPNPNNPTEALTGNDATGYPPGPNVYAGPRLSGPGYTAQLWGGPDAGSLTPAMGFSTSTFRTGVAAGLWETSASAAIIVGVPEGWIAQLEVRAWDNQGGTITTWAQAVAAGVFQGESAVFTSPPLGGAGGAPPELAGLTSFNIHAVPEPSTFALAGLGAALLVLFRRA